MQYYVIENMCIRPWQGRLVHFEKKLPGANVVGSQPIGTLGDLDFPLAIDPPKVSKTVQNVQLEGARNRSGHRPTETNLSCNNESHRPIGWLPITVYFVPRR